MTIEERINNIKNLTQELLCDIEAELKKKAEIKGDPVYEGIYEATGYFKEMMSWLEDIPEELES